MDATTPKQRKLWRGPEIAARVVELLPKDPDTKDLDVILGMGYKILLSDADIKTISAIPGVGFVWFGETMRSEYGLALSSPISKNSEGFTRA